MIEIQGLATSPKHQGRGYGSALVEAVASLVSDNVLGFVVVAMLGSTVVNRYTTFYRRTSKVAQSSW